MDLISNNFFMKKIFFCLGSLFILIGFFTSAHAADIPITLRIETNASSTIVQISLPDGCNARDSKGMSQEFNGYKAVCALEAAKKTNAISDFQITPLPPNGFFLDSINGLTNAPDFSSFWIIRVNNALSQSGIDSLALSPNDEVLITYGPWAMEPLQLVSSTMNPIVGDTLTLSANIWNDNSTSTNAFEPYAGSSTFFIDGAGFPSVASTFAWTADSVGQKEVWVEAVNKTRSKRKIITVSPASFVTVPVSVIVATSTPSSDSGQVPSASSTSSPQASSGQGFSEPLHHSADIQKAVQFLMNNQKADGSFGAVALFTDWAAIALAPFTNGARDLVKTYLLSDPASGTLATDYERRAMALEALSINPYSGTKTNYIKKIIDTFDGKQFGNSDLVNDDIFALFPLLHAGIAIDDPMIKSAVSFIMANQQLDGSWIGGIDITSAAIQGLFPLSSLDGVSLALQKAKDYLQSKQGDNGGFDNNVSSSSWALQAIISLGQREEDWQKGGNTVRDYLFWNQAQDGGFPLVGELNARIWETSYALPALLKKPWSDILMDFSKPIVSQATGTIQQGVIAQPILATSTPMLIATSQKFDVSTTKLPSTVLVYPAPTPTPVDSIKKDNPLENAPLPQKKNVPQMNHPTLKAQGLDVVRFDAAMPLGLLRNRAAFIPPL